MSGRRQALGFTLVELMIIIALLAIVATIAIPNFMSLIERNRTLTQAQELKSFLLYARSEAVTLKSPVTVEEDSEGQWIIKNNDNETIRQLQLSNELLSINSSSDTLHFRNNGTATAANFVVCQDSDAETGVYLQVQASGAVTLFTQGTKDANGTALSSCTP